jgi:SAM-dependent methyltransferase
MKQWNNLYLALACSTLALTSAAVAAEQPAVPSDAIWLAQQEATRRPDVPYVPTIMEVVDEMLRMAKVGKQDVVYDLGCGDGRIVIAAAKKYGARGVGVDIDPERIKEARANAEKEGVTDKVKFIQQDLFETDVSQATVVALYLLPDINLKLRPKLLEELKPGTRVVSHNYDMGDWKPERKASVGTHTVYLWTIREDTTAQEQR